MPADAIKTYILAKDGNRPYLMRRAFAERRTRDRGQDRRHQLFRARPRVSARSKTFSCGSSASIMRNVTPFAFSEPPPAGSVHFACHWLVGMSAKANGQIRIGCGRYDWYFNAHGQVEKLVIAIDVMKVLAADQLRPNMNWFSALPYPWCSAGEALRQMPASDGLAEISSLSETAPASLNSVLSTLRARHRWCRKAKRSPCLFRRPFVIYLGGHRSPGGPAMSALKPLKIDIVSDVVCPWCYIGKRGSRMRWRWCRTFPWK